MNIARCGLHHIMTIGSATGFTFEKNTMKFWDASAVFKRIITKHLTRSVFYGRMRVHSVIEGNQPLNTHTSFRRMCCRTMYEESGSSIDEVKCSSEAFVGLYDVIRGTTSVCSCVL